MSRLIDADALIGELHTQFFYDGRDRTRMYERIQSQPTIEPERKTGKWIDMNTPTTNYYPRYKCSACGNWSGMAKYCPNCGARMEEA